MIKGIKVSTNDVPGADPKNNDTLHLGCWAEHADGSLIFVESTEGGRVVYSIFDRSKEPVVEYRDSMPEINFKRQFSWSPAGLSKERWTWHDKTPFEWDRVIKAGVQDGLRFASASGLKTAAERVGESLHLRAVEFDKDRSSHLQDEELARSNTIYSRLEQAINGLPAAIASAVQGVLPGKAKPKRKK